jgi:hypothetical protein
MSYATKDVELAGRIARIQWVRVAPPGRRMYYRVLGVYLDNDETFSMTQGEFAKWSRALERAAEKRR